MSSRPRTQDEFFAAAGGVRPERGGGAGVQAAFNFVLRRWRFILTVAFFIVVLGFMHISHQTPLYTATAQLLIDPRKEKAAGQDAIIADIFLDAAMFESQIAVVKSNVLLRRVVEKMRLLNDPEFGLAASAEQQENSGPLASIRSLFAKGKNAAPDLRGKDAALPTEQASPQIIAAAEKLRGALTVVRAGQAFVLNISFTSTDAVKGARLANAIADAYIVDKLDARLEAAKRASSWLSDRLVELRRQVRQSEEAIGRFRLENNLTETALGSTLNEAQLAELNQRLISARAETAEKKARLEVLHKIEARDASIGSIPDVMNTVTLADLRKQENDLSRQLAELHTRYIGDHPSIVNLKAQQSDVQRAVKAEVKRLAATVANEYELAKAHQGAVEKTLQEIAAQYYGLDNIKATTLRELERNAAVNKTIFEDFLQRSKVTQEQSTFELRDARVITPALPSNVPTSPKKMQFIVISLLVGLGAGAGLAYLLEKLNAGLTTAAQVEEMLNLPVIASIAKLRKRDLTVDHSPVPMSQYVAHRPMSYLSEAFRSLRGAVQMSDVDHPPKVLQITSTIPSEGKTTIALALAASWAQAGLKILLLEADLRHPSASHFLNVAANSPGVVEYLTGTAELADTIGYDSQLQLWFLPAGGKTQNPSDLLGSERMKRLVEVLRGRFDLIIIDTPPAGLVIDPIIVSHLVDKIIFVVRWAATPREMVAQSITRLGDHKKLSGIAFNYVDEAQAAKYGGAHYYRHHYYESYSKK